MSDTVRSVMTTRPVTLPAAAPVVEAARAMREADIGDVIVLEHDRIAGILTDRDIVVRGLAEGRDLRHTSIGDICSRVLTTVSDDVSVEEAIRIMREKAVRRLPVVAGDQPIGVVSLGDLALKRDRLSALGDISAASPNH
jgi:CBS domain-containing protein